MASTFIRKIGAFLATFLFNFFSGGTITFNGVLYESIENSDGFSSTSTGLLFMLPYATSRILGPAVSVMMNYVNPRLLVTLGAFLFGSGFCCSGLFPLQPIYLFPCYILSGVGLGCVNIPCVWYLEKSFGAIFRSIMPLAMSGSYVGLFIIPKIAAYVKQEYGTGAALLLFGVTGWNLIPCGLIFPSFIPTPCKDNHHSNTRSSRCQGIREDGDQMEVTPESDDRNNYSSLKDEILRMLVMLTDELFLFFVLTACIRKIPNDAWTLFLIPRVYESGLSLQAAATVGSAGGLGGIVGRFVAALSFKTSENASLILFCLYFVCNGIVFIITETLLINLGRVWLLCLASFCNGILLSAQSGMVAGVLHLFIKPEQYVAAYGSVELGLSIFSPLAGMAPGLLIDSSVGFETIFITLGLISILNGCFVLVITLMINLRSVKTITKDANL